MPQGRQPFLNDSALTPASEGSGGRLLPASKAGRQRLRQPGPLPRGYGGQEEEVFTVRGVPSERFPGLASSPSAFTAVMR